MTYKGLKLKLISKGLTFKNLVEADGRSYTYLYREATANNQKILKHLVLLAENISKEKQR